VPADREAVHLGPVSERPAGAASVDGGRERRHEQLPDVVLGNPPERVADAVSSRLGASVEPECERPRQVGHSARPALRKLVEVGADHGLLGSSRRSSASFSSACLVAQDRWPIAASPNMIITNPSAPANAAAMSRSSASPSGGSGIGHMILAAAVSRSTPKVAWPSSRKLLSCS
jgi:hypothetical protein